MRFDWLVTFFAGVAAAAGLAYWLWLSSDKPPAAP